MCKAKPNKTKKQFSWVSFVHTFRYIWPYIWPSGKPGLQFRFFTSLLIIGINRGLNVLIPVLFKEIVDNLLPHYNTSASRSTEDIGVLNNTYTYSQLTTQVPTQQPLNHFRWDIILVLVVLKALSGGGGYLNCIRGLLWIRVLQNAQKRVRLDMFSKIHSLTVKWHQENKRTGAIVTLIDRGVVGMNLIISNLLFNVVPTLADIVIASVFFVAVLNIWTGFIVFSSIVGYLVATIVLGEWRTKFKTGMTKADNERSAVFVDSVLNYETVKCFSGEETELNRYEDKIDSLQVWDYKSDTSSKMIMAIQKTMMASGLLGVSVLAAWYVWTGKFTIGDFVLFSSYVEQLYSPLTMFSACYRILQDASINMEHMIKVAQIEPDIKDGPKTLAVTKGEVSFKGVYFTHGTSVTPLLKNINFTIPAGKTYAIVGNSGGGKSTILKLLLRFYDVTMGKITIDGVDISEVTQKSLRQNIGVLPQNATLFNQDISYNIRYSRTSADQSEIEDAAKDAQIHDKISKLEQGYGTRVGENGVKLSGGEKRRVVIARAILEGAQIILLDEATAGLDNITENGVWTALDRLRSDKTTLIVSHQLSNIMHADKILVLKDGEIIEEGTHTELRALKQFYEELWLVEHPEETTEFYYGPSFGCTVPDCTCSCHQENQIKNTEPMSRCSSMECYCNCHDLEVEENVLAILKQESEQGMFDDSDLESKQTNTTSEESASSEEKATEAQSRSKSDSERTEALLETIHEVPSTEERDDVFNSLNKRHSEGNTSLEESDPFLWSVPKSPTPKLGQITPQHSFDVGDEIKRDIAKSPLSESSRFQLPSGSKSQSSAGSKSHSLGGSRSQSSSKDPSSVESSKSLSGKKRANFTKNKSLSIQDDDDIRLVISGRSFNLKPKKQLIANLFPENKMLEMSLPAGKLSTRKSGGKLPPLVRSKTVDISTSPVSPLRTFKEIQKQRLKKQEKLERAEEKERDRARTMIDEASSVVSLLPEDMAMMDTMPDNFDEDALHPLCASSNFPLGLESFRKPLLNSNSSSDRETSIDMSNV